MFGKVFVSPQLKQILIISNKYGIYKLPQELPNDLGPYEIRKYQEDLKTS